MRQPALNLVAINSVAAFTLTTMLLSWIHHEYRAGWITVLSHPDYLLAGSLLLGYLVGWAAPLLARWLGKREELQRVMLLALIVLAVGAAEALTFSLLLTLLTIGVMVKNMDENHDLIPVENMKVGQIFFMVLFVATGATLQESELINGGAIAGVDILARFVGRSVGIMSLAYLSGIRPGSGGLLAIALTPMSALAIVMVHITTSIAPEFGARLAAIVLSAVLVLEVIGLLVVQYALRKSGEAGEDRA